MLATPAKPQQKAPDQANEIDWKARRQIAASDMPPPAKHDNWIKSSYPFVYGQFDPALFPTAEWRECNRMALAVLEIRNWAADMVDRDDPLLIEQIQARLLPRRGIFANPDEIIVTLGAQNALYMLATLLMTKGSKVAMEDPGYPDARSIFRLAGAEIAAGAGRQSRHRHLGHPARCRLRLRHAQPSLPDHGAAVSAERRQDLLARASRNNQIIIEDGYDSQLLDEAPQQALKSLDRSGRVIYVGSMSKTLAPGLRLGYIVASAELIAELRALRRFMLRHPPANNQRAVALFLSLGHHEALVRRLSTAFEERRKRLVQAISAFLPEWRSTDSAGGTSLWLEGPRGTDSRGAGRGRRRAQRHHRARRPLLRPHRKAVALHAAWAFPRSRCSISSPASANWRPPPGAGPRQPDRRSGRCLLRRPRRSSAMRAGSRSGLLSALAYPAAIRWPIVWANAACIVAQQGTRRHDGGTIAAGLLRSKWWRTCMSVALEKP